MDFATLASCAQSTESSTVVFDVTSISFPAFTNGRPTPPIEVASNKTIQGPVEIVSPGSVFMIVGQHDIILREVGVRIEYGVIVDHPLLASDKPQLCPDPNDPSLSDEDLLNGCGRR